MPAAPRVFRYVCGVGPGTAAPAVASLGTTAGASPWARSANAVLPNDWSESVNRWKLSS